MDAILVQAYNQVFSLQGNLALSAVRPPVSYVQNRLASMLVCDNINNILSCARNSSDEQLAEILFKAVAGEYTVGKGALQQTTCMILADPLTGSLTLQDATLQNREILTIIIVILFLSLGWIIYKTH